MKKLLTLFFCLFAGSLIAQEAGQVEYPFYVLPGEQFRVPSNSDTLWVFDHHTYKNAVKMALRSEMTDSLNYYFELKNQKLQEVIVNKDSIIAVTGRGYVHYRDLWDKTDRELEEAEIKAAQRWRFALWGFVVGGTVATITGFAVKNFVD